jgi:hypothetical protein
VSAAHWHLVLVHIPVLFVPFALLLLIFSLWRRQPILQQLAASLFVASALVAVPAFLTGEPAEEQVEELPHVSNAAIEEHEASAEWAFYLTLSAGVFGLGWLLSSRRERLRNGLQAGLLVTGLTSSLALLRTANLGGKVSHPELRSENSLSEAKVPSQ